MKKAFSVLIGAAAALVLGTFSSAAEDISIEPKFAAETADGVSFSINSNKFAASQLKEGSVLNVSCTGGEGEECPFKLLVGYWNSKSEANQGVGEPVSVEVPAAEYKDGTASYKYEDIVTALDGADLSKVFTFDVAAAGTEITCTGIEAKDVYSAAEAAENGLLHTVHVHAKNPITSENWKQSLTVGVDLFDTSTLTQKSYAIAMFESEVPEDTVNPPVEMIFQSTDDKVSPKAKNGTVWAKIRPVRFNNVFAFFPYDTMTEAYGTDDFSCVSTVYIGDTGESKITCTDLYVLSCKTLPPADAGKTEDSSAAESKAEEVTTTTAAPESKAEVTTTEAAAESKAAAETVTSSSDGDSFSKSLIFIIIGIAAGVILAVVVVIIILNKKAGEAYDINKHKFIKK
ncbi:hypothetical protein SAMN02910317_02912 [Ruminococcaceae bacterium FB2012]|nr:hypothetical protein SAMN02910317_02912 [Ruminococcaceae bacterium FB2012]